MVDFLIVVGSLFAIYALTDRFYPAVEPEPAPAAEPEPVDPADVIIRFSLFAHGHTFWFSYRPSTRMELIHLVCDRADDPEDPLSWPACFLVLGQIEAQRRAAVTKSKWPYQTLTKGKANG